MSDRARPRVIYHTCIILLSNICAAAAEGCNGKKNIKMASC